MLYNILIVIDIIRMIKFINKYLLINRLLNIKY